MRLACVSVFSDCYMLYVSRCCVCVVVMFLCLLFLVVCLVVCMVCVCVDLMSYVIVCFV